MPKNSLQDVRDKFAKLIQEANNVYITMKEDQVHSQSLVDAERSARKGSPMGFTLNDKHRFREIQREVKRANQFLQDVKAEGVFKEVNPDKWKGKFGNQWRSVNGSTYDTSVIKREEADMAFEAFRKVEEEMAHSIQSYGSDTLVQYLYDFVIMNPSLKFLDEELAIDKIRRAGKQAIIDAAKNKKQLAYFERKSTQREYGKLMKYSTAKEYRNDVRW